MSAAPAQQVMPLLLPNLMLPQPTCSLWSWLSPACCLPADCLLSQTLAASECAERLQDAHSKYLSDGAGERWQCWAQGPPWHTGQVGSTVEAEAYACCPATAVSSLLPCLALFAHLVSNTLLQGSATSHVAPVEPADRE